MIITITNNELESILSCKELNMFKTCLGDFYFSDRKFKPSDIFIISGIEIVSLLSDFGEGISNFTITISNFNGNWAITDME